MARRTLFIAYFAGYVLAISGVLRIVFGESYRWERYPPNALLLGVYLVLLFAEPIFFRRTRIRTYLYMIAQSATICGIVLTVRQAIIPYSLFDYWGLLFCPLVVQAMVNLESRTGYVLTGILTAITACLLLPQYSRGVGLTLLFMWASAYLLIGTLVAVSREAAAARDESQRQQAELQLAHQQLQDYTERAEELAVLQERNRLARELHDAVTQTLFSASLIAEALPALWERDPEMGRERLAMLRQMSRGALAEMRTLLLELRPAALVETSLEDLLHQLGEAVTGREGMPVTVEVEGVCELPPDLHVALYRIAQEALNNVVRHARASRVAVHLRCTPRVPSSPSREGEVPAVKVELVIHDDGRGFEPDDVPPEHMGLGIMRERAEAVGARLRIVSQTSQGTQVTVVWPEDEGQQNNHSSSTR